MPDWTQIVISVIATLSAGGWLVSRRLRKKDEETHRAEMEALQADIAAKIKQTDTQYVTDALRIYSENVVKPLEDKLREYRDEQVRFQSAVNMAPRCQLYPNCVIIRELQNAHSNTHPAS